VKLRLGHCYAHSLVGGQQAQCVPGVQHGDGTNVKHHVGQFRCGYRTRTQPVDVHRNEHQSVRGDAAHVGVNQCSGDCFRRLPVEASAYEHSRRSLD